MGEGSGLDVATGGGSGGSSDRVIRLLKPGNAGGGKDPDLWCAFEDGEVVVIGDEPENTIKDRRRPRLLYRGEKESDPPCRSRLRLAHSPRASR